MEERYIRTAMLIGKSGVDKLLGSKVIIIGVGGVGGYVTEALARAGVGTLTLVDADVVAISNINRQIIATLSSVGKEKVKVFEQRISDINPDCKVNTVAEFITPDNLNSLKLEEYDYVVDAIDTVSTKLAIAQLCEQKGIPLISSLGTGNKLDPTALKISDIYKTSVCPLARAMRTELKKLGVKHLKVVFSEEVPIKPDEALTAQLSGGGRNVGSISFVPSAAGLIIASEVVRELTAEK